MGSLDSWCFIVAILFTSNLPAEHSFSEDHCRKSHEGFSFLYMDCFDAQRRVGCSNEIRRKGRDGVCSEKDDFRSTVGRGFFPRVPIVIEREGTGPVEGIPGEGERTSSRGDSEFVK